MHMDADYPFMLPKILAYDGKTVTIEGSDGTSETFIARRRRKTGMYGWLKQSSSFEKLFNRPPQRFEMRPFKDDNSPSIAELQTARSKA
jgi:hypothetical protein